MYSRLTFIILLLSLFGCQPEQSEFKPKIMILHLSNADTATKIAAHDLQQDLFQVIQAEIQIGDISEEVFDVDLVYLVGEFDKLASEKSRYSRELTRLMDDRPQKRGGLIQPLDLEVPTILLSGGDVQGTQYSVYDYATQVLGIDPLAYWTGSQPQPVTWQKLVQSGIKMIAPPVIPYLVYFENDVDELANLKAPLLEYDWQSFTELVDSLVRLGYNGIEFFDMLGRVEFYTRPEYLAAHPDYQLDVEYLDKMIDYVHDKGMYVQMDMMMGRQLLTLNKEASECWTEHKQEWLDTWETYLTDTPVKKADIFALRPRHQVWDWEYQSSCGEDKAKVFNEVYLELGKLIDQYKSDAVKVCTCYHDGMEIFNENFNPPKDWIIAWSDNGWAEFDYLPKSTKGYQFGTYMHAGFWLNHDVFDPNPEVIDATMDMMYNRFDATSYMMVNGQTFRPFILNLEAFAESARLGTRFDGEQFYLDWADRYFGSTVALEAVSAMKKMHEAHQGKVGYVEILWQVKNLQAYLADIPVRRPGREEFTVTRDKIAPWLNATQPRLEALNEGIGIALKAEKKLSHNGVFFHDHIVLPLHIYHDLLKYNQILIDLVRLKHQLALQANPQLKKVALVKLQDAETQLNLIYQRRIQGDKEAKWATWYAPEKRRPNNGFPQMADLVQVRAAVLNW